MHPASTTLGTPLPASSVCRPPRRLFSARPTCAGLSRGPDYAQPWKGRAPPPRDLTLANDHDVRTGRRTPSGRKWWQHVAPTRAIGRPSIRLTPVMLPALGPGGSSGGSVDSSGGSGGGGRGGSSGGGNGGSNGGGNGGGGGGNPMQGPTYLFAAALMAGGLMAFFRRGSYKSLMFSAAAVILLLVAASLMHHRSGTLLAMGTSLVLAFVMGQRANRSGKVFPAGVVALVSAAMTIGYARVLA